MQHTLLAIDDVSLPLRKNVCLYLSKLAVRPEPVLADRTMPNTVGVHFYDEQGLISHKHPATGDETRHNVPVHERGFRNTFGQEPPQYYKIDPNNRADLASWAQWCRWKVLLLESAWQKCAFGMRRARPDFIAINQSVWAWDAWTSGHYFNQVRPLDAICGHGKYSWANRTGFYLPAMSWEFGRIRDLKKEAWQLPTWYTMPGGRHAPVEPTGRRQTFRNE